MADANRPVTGYPAPNQNGFSQPPPPSGAAYPYAAPPPPQNYYYTTQPYPQDPYYNTQRATFLRRLFAIIIASFIITGSIIFIIWLVLRPRLPEFRVDSFSVSSFNISSNSLSGSWDLQLTARNPNSKMTLSYDPIQAAVFYRGDSLADTYLPPFTQGKRNETAIRATFAASKTYVENWVVDGINGERGKNNGNVGFNVRMVAEVRFKAGQWRMRRRIVKVYCPDLLVSIPKNGSSTGGLVGGPRQCRVGL